MLAPTYAGAVEPEREVFLDVRGVRLHVAEWGDPARTPVLLCHGFWDHVRSFATLAPLLAARHRVVALDARGHGDSGWADAYAWSVRCGDIAAVLEWLAAPAHLVGHSMGGGLVIEAARSVPDRVRQVVSLDGFGPPPFPPEQQAQSVARLGAFLDQRRAAARRPDWRPYTDLEQLVERRRAQNPRLGREWLRYFAFHGARRAADGWRWKADPLLAHDAGPWRPEWIAPGYARLRQPLLAVIGSEDDTWGPLPEAILAPRLAGVRQLTRATIAGAGHFMHMERPAETAALLLDWMES